MDLVDVSLSVVANEGSFDSSVFVGESHKSMDQQTARWTPRAMNGT
jgi:hypothetical protein